MSLVKYHCVGDRFAGSPYVRLAFRCVGDTPVRHVNHRRQTAVAERIARTVWGEKAGAVRLGHGHYQLVWCGSDAPTPGFFTDGHNGHHYLTGEHRHDC